MMVLWHFDIVFVVASNTQQFGKGYEDFTVNIWV